MRLIVKERAVTMAQDAFRWYESKREGLGEEFLVELEKSLNLVKSQPTLFTTIKKNFRQSILKRFPYIIVFEVFKSEIVVYSIFHMKQNPKTKFRKR